MSTSGASSPSGNQNPSNSWFITSVTVIDAAAGTRNITCASYMDGFRSYAMGDLILTKTMTVSHRQHLRAMYHMTSSLIFWMV